MTTHGGRTWWGNVTVTRSLLNAKVSPIHGVPLRHYRQLLASVIAGTHRAKDRLNAAGLYVGDTCETDGQRHTSEHVAWHCAKWATLREPYLRKMQSIIWIAGTKVASDIKRYLCELLDTPVFRHWDREC